MIRSSKISLKFANTGKLSALSDFVDEYRRVAGEFVDILWDRDQVPTLLPKALTDLVDTWLSARAVQCAGKQASGVVRGTRKKQSQRAWRIRKLEQEGKHKQARKLSRIHAKMLISKPCIDQMQPQLDGRFVSLDLASELSFDGCMVLGSLGRRLRLVLPFKRTKHLNELLERGKLLPGIRISKTYASLVFEIEDPPPRTEGKTVGIDVGQTTVWSCSTGDASTVDTHGYTLRSITHKLARKKKGSKGFARAAEHRRNYINWSLNQLSLQGVQTIRLEKIKGMRKSKRTSRGLSHWTYTVIFDKLESLCEEHGVRVERVEPAYTSRRCSVCGWTRQSNRKGKQFKCGQCGFCCDADLNASRNIALTLPPISRGDRLNKIDRRGFWWLCSGQEPIVPAVQEAVIVIS